MRSSRAISGGMGNSGISVEELVYLVGWGGRVTSSYLVL